MGFATYSIEGHVQRLIDERGASAEFLGQLSKLYNISGASQSRISQALRGVNGFTFEHDGFRILVQNLEEFLVSMEPVPVALKNPQLIKRLLDGYLEKKDQEQALIRSCFVIEFDNQELFAGFVDGVCQRTRVSEDALAIKDQATASAAAGLLGRCRSVSVRKRVTEGQMACSLPDLGFKSVVIGDSNEKSK
jgi:hypothetical protein